MPDFSQSHDVFWRRIAAADPRAIAQSTGAVYDDVRKVLVVPLLGDVYAVYPSDRRIVDEKSPDREPSFDVKVILVNYLASGESGTVTGEWVGEQSLPGGAIFFRGTHELPRQPIIATFGNDVERLAAACRLTGGTPVDVKGDVAVEFAALPRVLLRMIYWEDDGEFPPGVTFLFDRSAATFLPLDGLLAVVKVLAKRLTASPRNG